MVIFKSAADLRAFVSKKKDFDVKTGFVPTMGALHQGHITLIEHCRNEQNLTIASIFVNPTQFNDPGDFNNYPVTIESDIAKLEKAGCNVLFLPSVSEIYPGGLGNKPQYDLGSLETLLEGYYRPGHFQGVCQVMDRLLSIVDPDHLYMGSKDYQQCMVIKRLMLLKNFHSQFHMVSTVRETDGLAMSSRNMRLTPAERQQAVSIYQQFEYIKQHAATMPLRLLEQKASENLLQAGFTGIDYVSIANPETLEPLPVLQPNQPARVLIAAFLGKVRLIDNLEMIA